MSTTTHPLPLPATMTRNITRVFRRANERQIAKGLGWYDAAAAHAEHLNRTYGVTFEVAAGVIAALSPNNSWGHNQRLAERFVAAGGLTSGYFKDQLAKAQAILGGAPIAETLGGLKTRNFYLGIVTRGAEGMTIDRHAYAIAVNRRGETPSLGAKRYAEFVAAYERAASILTREVPGGLTPAQVQAVTWVAWRDDFWAEGAWE